MFLFILFVYSTGVLIKSGRYLLYSPTRKNCYLVRLKFSSIQFSRMSAWTIMSGPVGEIILIHGVMIIKLMFFFVFCFFYQGI